MAENGNDSKVISKKNAGFPEWLDFDKLRTENLKYLGELSGRIWTDHNVHDPGVTIMETLSYAIMDLGYRTALPLPDLLAEDPQKPGTNQFFTPARILTCNPLTIPDYRKLLVEVKGVRNAWLSVADEVTIEKLCSRNLDIIRHRENKGCNDGLNGLYHVYLELDGKPDENEKNAIVQSVRQQLMSFRNICEDFFDITILCPQPIGVCADITLEDNADIESVYIQLVEQLHKFLSPAPEFYRLKDLLEKGTPIEEIFEGRPYNLMESRGFVDTAALERIELKKEVHLSDLYQLAGNIHGIKSVQSLRLVNCDRSICRDDKKEFGDWMFHVYENHVLQFSTACSSFRFSRNGVPVKLETAKFERYFEMAFSVGDRAVFPVDSSALDLQPPKGVYRPGLDAYYPLYQEFPRVYGIGNDGLPDNAPTARKAQALQLRAYLLFFDQLLAGYLSQLRGVKDLLSLNPSPSVRSTYFTNELKEYYGLESLLRFGEQSVTPSLQQGQRLAIPVEKNALEKLVASPVNRDCDPVEGLQPYAYNSSDERDQAVLLLREELANGVLDAELHFAENKGWFFYYLPSSQDFGLVSTGYFKSENEAATAAGTTTYLASEAIHYHNYVLADLSRFSFDISFQMHGRHDQLQSLVEEENVYLRRRKQFIDHLLARFAQRFTDFAQLSYGDYTDQELLKEENKHKENFLRNYPDLSANRGKAYDYALNGWSNQQVSGFEKRFTALAGIKEEKRKERCHFEVIRYEEEVVIDLTIGKTKLFSSSNSFESRDEGNAAFDEMMRSLSDPGNLGYSFQPLTGEYRIELRSGSQTCFHPVAFRDTQQAEQAVQGIKNLFALQPPDGSVTPSLYHLHLQLTSLSEDHRLHRKQPLAVNDTGFTFTDDQLGTVNDEAVWEMEGARNMLTLKKAPDAEDILVDISPIEIIAYPADRDNEGLRFKLSICPVNRLFLLLPEEEFADPETAQQHAIRLLHAMTERSNYKVDSSNPGVHKILLYKNGVPLAAESGEYSLREDAWQAVEQMISFMRGQTYTLVPSFQPVRWKFQIDLGIPGGNNISFQSRKTDYASFAEAEDEAGKIFRATSEFDMGTPGDAVTIRREDNPRKILAAFKIQSENPDARKEEENLAKEIFQLKRSINRLLIHNEETKREEYVVRDKKSAQGDYGYQLVKKNTYLAFYSGRLPDANDPRAQINEVYGLFRNATDFLDICYGGDHIVSRQDQRSKATLYYYTIASRKHKLANGKDLVLFQSTKGFASCELADKAFRENYVAIIQSGGRDPSYGTDISYEMPPLPSEHDQVSGPVVFIPEETMEHFGFNRDTAKKELMRFCLSYPVRAVKEDDEEFAKLFNCGAPSKNTDCRFQSKTCYYFILADPVTNQRAWISSDYFEDARTALDRFYFFLILLGYKGNYHFDTDDCECTRRLFIREVMAVSAQRFPSPAEAWGKQGVEKFACVAQSAVAFKAYHDPRCHYSFYLACPEMGLTHPCTYDRPEKRDKAMTRLLQGATALAEYGSIRKYIEHLSDHDLNRFDDPCEIADKIREAVKNGDLSGAGGLTPEQWKALTEFLLHFPVVKKTNPSGNSVQFKYYIELELPGFSKETDENDQPCTCGEKPVLDCHCTSWVSACCFNTCREALDYLDHLILCLQDPSNYYRTFDCTCGSYGISFHCACAGREVEQGLLLFNHKMDIPDRKKAEDPCCSEIIAYNPQHYTTPEMACDAMDRAYRLANAEGLHLIEHILLRPHCEEGDCNCLIPVCGDEGCYFEWKPEKKDPCSTLRNYCLVPGDDPYSFIATIALPAWPARFSKKENRTLIEQMLYREAPAHVMLRILWLNPYDLCRLETALNHWHRWLAHKQVCKPDWSVCDLIRLLFEEGFGCYTCDPCIPCLEEPDTHPCFNLDEEENVADSFLNQLSETFCWPLPCKEERQEAGSHGIRLRANVRTIEPIDESGEMDESVHTDEDEEHLDAGRKIDRRFTLYRESAGAVFKNSGNINAKKAMAFLQHAHPHFAAYKEVTEDILLNKKDAENKRTLRVEEKRALISAITWFYLDHIVLEGKNWEEKDEMEALLHKLEKKELVPEVNQWKEKELKKLSPELDPKPVREIFKKGNF